MRGVLVRSVVVCTLLASLAGGKVRAADGEGPRTIAEAIEQLGAKEWAVRDAAEMFLLRQSPRSRPDIEQILLRTRDPEVATRLKRVALHLFLKSQTALTGQASLLGIRFALESVPLADGETRIAAAVIDLAPGFPAAEVLRPGDRIIGMKGQAFGPDLTETGFRQQVNGMKPGSQMELTVLRGRQETKVLVMLAGVPEEGVTALARYMDERAKSTTEYLAELASREPRSGGGVVIPDASSDADVPAIRNLRGAQ